MKRREMLYSDYGMSPEDVKELKARCKRMDAEDQITLLLCAIKANAGVAPALYYSLIYGLSYDALTYSVDIPINRGDFYAYQRYCLSLFSGTKIKPHLRMVYGPP